MRRKDRAISDDEAKQLLQNGEFGVLSTISKDNEPYGIPLSYYFLNDVLYFHSALEGKKLDNIINNNNCSFCVVGQTEVLQSKFSTKYESVIVTGVIEEPSSTEKQIGLEGLVKKYSPEFLEEGLKYISKAKAETKVLKLVIQDITGKARK